MILSQTSLDLTLKPTFHAKDFVCTQRNQTAFSWIEKWPQWPTPCLILYGPKGCGKTHLAHIWADKANAKLLQPEQWQNLSLEDFSKNPHSLVLEDITAPFDATHMLHLYNLIQENKKYLLITAETPVPMWKISLPDLQSRLQSASAVEIDHPDDELLKAVMVKLFADQQVSVETSVLDYLLPRIERSFASVQAIVRHINAFAFAKQRKITVPLVAQALQTNQL